MPKLHSNFSVPFGLQSVRDFWFNKSCVRESWISHMRFKSVLLNPWHQKSAFSILWKLNLFSERMFKYLGKKNLPAKFRFYSESCFFFCLFFSSIIYYANVCCYAILSLNLIARMLSLGFILRSYPRELFKLNSKVIHITVPR